MAEEYFLDNVKMQMLAAKEELEKLNALTAQFGLSLSEAQMESLTNRRFSALGDTGRVEFGEGVLKKLILAFCDSPYITRENYEETLTELQDSFYYFKNESEDRIPDDELIDFMKRVFDGRAQGSLDYLAGTSLDDLCRNTRYGYETDDEDGLGRPF